jgi:uracil-DNA glycosylase
LWLALGPRAGLDHAVSSPHARAVESALAFWAEAGVDACYGEEPVDRLAEGAARLKAKAVTPRPAAVAQPAAGGRQAAPDVSGAVEQARAMAAEAQTLEALAAAIAAFDGCGLKFEGAKQAVFARGNPEGPVMVIGEGPGGEEDARGEPFVGKAGQLLDRMLEAAGLKDRVFITNTVFWRPPGNRTPTLAEQAVCAPFLHQGHRPGAAEDAAAGRRGGGQVGAAAGRRHPDPARPLVRMAWRRTRPVLPALPTLHPAFLLRQPAAKKKAWLDLLTLTERLDRPGRPE